MTSQKFTCALFDL